MIEKEDMLRRKKEIEILLHNANVDVFKLQGRYEEVILNISDYDKKAEEAEKAKIAQYSTPSAS